MGNCLDLCLDCCDLKFNNDKYLSLITDSKIGFYNEGGSCYMASIIQILIHLRNFIEIFKKKK